jgi:hypothetical protein
VTRNLLDHDVQDDMERIERTASRIRAAAGCALGAFALWLGPAATAAFLIGLASVVVRLVLVRRKLKHRHGDPAGGLGGNPPTAAV